MSFFRRLFRGILTLLKWTIIGGGLIVVTLLGFMLGWKSWSPGKARLEANVQRSAHASILAHASRTPRASSRTAKVLDVAESSIRFGGTMSLGSARAFRSIEEIDPSDLARAFAMIVDRPATSSQQAVMALLLDRWSHLDPATAMTACANAFADDRETLLRYGRTPLLRLAVADPKAAFHAWQKHLDPLDKGYDNSTEFQLSGIFSEWAKQDLETAINHYQELSEDEADAALEGLVGSTDPIRRDRVLAFVEESGNVESLANARGYVVDRLSRSGNHEDAIAWIESQAIDDAARSPLEERMAKGWFDRDQRAAAAWLLERSDDSNRANRLADFANVWAEWEANAAGAWLGEMVEEHGAQADKAIRYFATAIAEKDPPTALDWVAAISNPAEREKAAQRVGREFGRRLMDGVDQLLVNSSLNESDRTLVLEGSKKRPHF